jgi:hypothetical protein
MQITNSHYVSRITGSKITIRTVTRNDKDSYIIFYGGWRVAEYRRKSSVRRYIMENDCAPIPEGD